MHQPGSSSIAPALPLADPDASPSVRSSVRFSENPDLAEFAALGELVHAIGTAQFEVAFYDTVSAFVGIDHYAIITFATGAARASSQAAKAFAEISRCYEAELFRLDPCVPQIMARKGEARPVSFDYGDGAAYLPFYRRKLLDAVGISDKHAFAFWRERTGYYVNLYLTHDRKFAEDDKRALDRLSVMLSAPIARHFSLLPRIPQGSSNFLERVLNASPLFAMTTAREKAVCLGILRGHTSESISLHLSISRNTVFTYRKRLYEKLGICSQHELFMLFIKSAQKFDRPSNDQFDIEFTIDSSIEWIDGFT